MNKLIEEIIVTLITYGDEGAFNPKQDAKEIADKCQQDFLKRALSVAEQSHEWVMGENQKDVFITKAGIIEALKVEFDNE